MGQKLAVSVEDKWDPRISPRTDRPPTFDPLYGFPNGRKPREFKADWEELERMQVPFSQRDYCAHLLIPYLRCMEARKPIAGHFCSDLLHTHEKCEYEDHLMRMKEYEREKRLLKRKLRKEQAAGIQK